MDGTDTHTFPGATCSLSGGFMPSLPQSSKLRTRPLRRSRGNGGFRKGSGFSRAPPLEEGRTRDPPHLGVTPGTLGLGDKWEVCCQVLLLGADADDESGLEGLGKILLRREALDGVRLARAGATDGRLGSGVRW